MEPSVEAGHPGHSDGAGSAHVRRHWSREVPQIPLGYDTCWGGGLVGARDALLPLRVQAGWSDRDEPVDGREHEHDVDDGACLRIGPGREDHDLGRRRSQAGKQPPPGGSASSNQRSGAEDERRGHQPGDAARRADRDPELGKARPAEALRGSEQMD